MARIDKQFWIVAAYAEGLARARERLSRRALLRRERRLVVEGLRCWVWREAEASRGSDSAGAAVSAASSALRSFSRLRVP